MTDLEAFLRWLFESNKKDVDIPPMTPRGKKGDYLSEGNGKGATDLALLAEAAVTQANMDAAEPNRDIGDPMSESQKALAEIRDSVLRGQVALAQARTWGHGLRESVSECIILRLYVVCMSGILTYSQILTCDKRWSSLFSCPSGKDA